jgi:hypothetical protein
MNIAYFDGIINVDNTWNLSPNLSPRRREALKPPFSYRKGGG